MNTTPYAKRVAKELCGEVDPQVLNRLDEASSVAVQFSANARPEERLALLAHLLGEAIAEHELVPRFNVGEEPASPWRISAAIECRIEAGMAIGLERAESKSPVIRRSMSRNIRNQIGSLRSRAVGRTQGIATHARLDADGNVVGAIASIDAECLVDCYGSHNDRESAMARFIERNSR